MFRFTFAFGLLLTFVCSTGLPFVPSTAFAQELELLGTAQISGKATDQSGLNEALSETYNNNLVGGFSAIEWTGKGDLYYFLSDRGPMDGAVDWTCRVQTVEVSFDSTKSELDAGLVSTLLLKNRKGVPFSGLASSFEATQTSSIRFDPEGIRFGQNGNFFVSDEYGPLIVEFDDKGQEVNRLEMPARYRIANPGLNKAEENPFNKSGRCCNRGMEGLAISADKQTLFGLMQSPLIQDSDCSVPDKPKGRNCRCLKINEVGDVQAEWVYRLDNSSNKLNELLRCSDSTFAVIERDGESGNESTFKKIQLVCNRNATDVRDVECLPAEECPAEIKPMDKRVLIDLLDPKWNLAGESMPEKIECLAFGPDLPDGRKMLLIASDNDFEPENPTWIYAFAVPKRMLMDWTRDADTTQLSRQQ